MTTEHVVEAGRKGFARGLAVDLAAVLRHANDGDRLVLHSEHPMLDHALNSWSRLLGHAIIEKAPIPGGGHRYVFRVGGPPDVSEDEEQPNERLWIYSNFHCNLACDYCCVSSSPQAAPRFVPVEHAAALAGEAAQRGFKRIIVTGGEPFMRGDIDEFVLACAEHLPTTLLTNGMLWEGHRRAILERLPRDRVTLQISLDSPDATLHDQHRGTGSWDRATKGIALARSLGFRVRVAATTASAEAAREMEAFLEAEGVAARDRLVRPIALVGEATEGVPLVRHEVRPELTITGDGIYWHPVGAQDPSFRVADPGVRLDEILDIVHGMEQQDAKDNDRLPAIFHCT